MSQAWNIDNSVLQAFQHEEYWQGSHYELGILYKQSLDEESRLHITRFLWDNPVLRGIVKRPEQFGQSWQPVDEEAVKKYAHCYGCARLAAGQIVGCASGFVAEGDTATWFTFHIPLAMLGLIFPVTYPVTPDANSWINQVDRFLATLGTRIYRERPFHIAVLGEEASAFPEEEILKRIADDKQLLVPETLFERLDVAPHGIPSPEKLWWTGGEEI